MIIFLERVEILEQSTLQTQMTLGGLDKYQNYSVRVAAATRVGQGLKSRSIYCRTLEDGSAPNLLIVFQLFKIFAHISVPGRPQDVKAASVDAHSVLVSWLPPARARTATS